MRLFFAIFLTLMFGQILPMTLQSQLLYAVVTLPGTFLHESAHYLTALWLQGHPTGFSIIPTWGGGEMQTMGHVLFQPSSLNAATVGLAPYLLFFPSCFFIAVAARCRVQWMVLWCYVAACGFASLTPSSQDWNIATSHPGSFLLAIPLFGLVAWGCVTGIKALARSNRS
jgi:hypothetical protein